MDVHYNLKIQLDNIYHNRFLSNSTKFYSFFGLYVKNKGELSILIIFSLLISMCLLIIFLSFLRSLYKKLKKCNYQEYMLRLFKKDKLINEYHIKEVLREKGSDYLIEFLYKVNFKKIKYNYFIIENCIFCLTQFQEGDEIILVNCGHMYHHNCLSLYIKDIKENNLDNMSFLLKCPVCRTHFFSNKIQVNENDIKNKNTIYKRNQKNSYFSDSLKLSTDKKFNQTVQKHTNRNLTLSIDNSNNMGESWSSKEVVVLNNIKKFSTFLIENERNKNGNI